MNNDPSQEELLQIFRTTFQQVALEKGIKAPTENSEREQQLFAQWKRGREALKNNRK